MEIDDRVTVATPEGVDIDVVVAGLGSRFMSCAVDSFIVLILMMTSFLLANLVDTAALAVASLGAFVAIFVYPTVCDAFAGGRTAGRVLVGLRLVTTSGDTVGFVSAAVRNIVRIVDFLPAFYFVGTVSILATDRNQRLGDVAGGTLVVRRESRRVEAIVVPGAARAPAVRLDLEASRTATGWDLTGVTNEDITVLRSFLGRRPDLDPDARRRLAADLARRLEPVVVGPDRRHGDEAFLEQVLAGRDRHGR